MKKRNESERAMLTKYQVLYFISIGLSELILFCAAMQFASSAIVGMISNILFSYVLGFVVSFLMFFASFFLKVMAYRYAYKYRSLSQNHRVPFYFHVYQFIFIIPMVYPGLAYIWVYSQFFYGVYSLIISSAGLLIGFLMTVVSTLYFLSTNSDRRKGIKEQTAKI